MPKSKILFFSCLAFITGVALASFLPLRILAHEFRWFGAAAAFWLLAILFWKRSEEFSVRSIIPVVFIAGVFFSLGLWRYAIGLPAVTADKIWFYNDQKVSVEGVITGEPDIRDTNQKLTLKTDRLEPAVASDPALNNDTISTARPVAGNLLVTTGLYPRYDYGDRLRIACVPAAPEAFEEFAYDRYLARYNIYSVCYYPQIDVLGKGGGNWLYRRVFQAKNRLRSVIGGNLSEPYAALAKAITLGDKKGIPADLRTDFSRAGISHLVAISGLHISLVAGLIMSALIGLGLDRRRAFYLACVLLFLYLVLIGLPPSALRAGLMGWLVLLALNLGRLNKLSRSLFLVAAILLAVNPRLLRDDIGFQLSFLAVLSIAYGFTLFENWFDRMKLPKLKGARDIFGISLAAQLFTWPVLVYNFHEISLAAPLTNILVLWTLPALLIAIIAAVSLSWLVPVIGGALFLPSFLLLSYISHTATLISHLPYSYLAIDHISPIWLATYYLILIWVIYFLNKRFKNTENKDFR